MKCFYCQIETSNPKFCNSSCAASYINKIKPKRKPEHHCKNCGKLVNALHRFCSEDCKMLFNTKTHKICSRCSKTFPNTKDFFYKRHGRTNFYSYCKSCFSIYQSNAKAKTKLLALEYKNQKSCSICGYDKSFKVLQFHHLDPSKKEFTVLSTRRRFDTIKKELDKCIVVCANCHNEIHAGLHPQYLKVGSDTEN